MKSWKSAGKSWQTEEMGKKRPKVTVIMPVYGASLRLKKGETVGLIGVSGGGKTTDVDMILGLLQPQSGQVLVGGRDINTDKAGWFAQVGYIPQTIFLLKGTVRENIAYGEEPDDIDDDKVRKAVCDTSMEEFISRLPDGLETEVGERGVRLSGGQRQRIGIARALYHNPKVLIFDEATSALDTETESNVIETMEKFKGDKTMLIITHRMSTCVAIRSKRGEAEKKQFCEK